MLWCTRCGQPGANLGGAIGPWPPVWVARIAKVHRKVSKIEACPPPFASWASGFQALDSKSPDIGRKMGRNLNEDLFFCSSPDFGRKNGTKFECDNFKFWSMFLSNFLKSLPPSPLFKILRTLLGQPSIWHIIEKSIENPTVLLL